MKRLLAFVTICAIGISAVLAIKVSLDVIAASADCTPLFHHGTMFYPLELNARKPNGEHYFSIEVVDPTLPYTYGYPNKQDCSLATYGTRAQAQQTIDKKLEPAVP